MIMLGGAGYLFPVGNSFALRTWQACLSPEWPNDPQYYRPKSQSRCQDLGENDVKCPAMVFS